MQIVTGSRVHQVEEREIVAWVQAYERVVLDLGTGDGRSVIQHARHAPRTAVIGVDLCAANLGPTARKAGDNARFLVADACALPSGIIGVASHITIAFPWGSLLRGVLGQGDTILWRLIREARAETTLHIVLNAEGALACGLNLHEAADRVLAGMIAEGCTNTTATALTARELRSLPSSWAKRLAFGRDPRAIAIAATVPAASPRSTSEFARPESLYHPIGIAPTEAIRP